MARDCREINLGRRRALPENTVVKIVSTLRKMVDTHAALFGAVTFIEREEEDDIEKQLVHQIADHSASLGVSEQVPVYDGGGESGEHAERDRRRKIPRQSQVIQNR